MKLLNVRATYCTNGILYCRNLSANITCVWHGALTDLLVGKLEVKRLPLPVIYKDITLILPFKVDVKRILKTFPGSGVSPVIWQSGTGKDKDETKKTLQSPV